MLKCSNDLLISILDYIFWDLLIPFVLSYLVLTIGKYLAKRIRERKLKRYQKKKTDAVITPSFISLAENLLLESDYFKVDNIDLERPFYIAFPKGKKEELQSRHFDPVFTNKECQNELKEKLRKYISSYYGENIKYNKVSYTIENFINKIAEETSDKFITEIDKGNVRFNKYMFGVCNLETTQENSTITVYQSDYFTFKCITSMFNALKKITCTQALPYKNTPFKVSDICPFLNSIGVGGFLIMDRGYGDEIVVSLRGNNCDSGGYWHFSFDETFTADDINQKGKCSLKECLRRALVEELGILKEEQDKALPEEQIILLDSGIIHTDGDDNRFEFEVCSFARICFSEQYTFDDFIKGYRFAKDAELETRCLDFIRINEMDSFIKTKDMLMQNQEPSIKRQGLSPEARNLLEKIKIIYQCKLLGSDNDGFMSLQNKIHQKH